MKDKERYDIFRHHAWAGTALLSVLLAVRYMIPRFPYYLFTALCTLLILYIVVSLLYTFKYRRGLSDRDMSQLNRDERKQQAKIDEERLKVEKKKSKAEAKQRKKNEKQ